MKDKVFCFGRFGNLMRWLAVSQGSQLLRKAASIAAVFLLMELMLLLMINIVLLLLGTCIDALPLQMILVPILLPAVMAYGVNPIQFGVVVIFNLMIGILTPPMGTALFVVSRVGNIQFKTLVKGVLPFLIPLIITLILLNVFPQITLFLPTLLTGGV